jgi:hypothetical protein
MGAPTSTCCVGACSPRDQVLRTNQAVLMSDLLSHFLRESQFSVIADTYGHS